uniref:C3H1-type domain-containing protein n=1 Tax=Trichuris muris TaxID=70415 RepID=A0A5S6QP98_TRIMR
MLIASPDLLREWICVNLSPICDADPSALAKYVMALLKKEKQDDELVAFLTQQLEVFLQKNTVFFVEKLITAIREKAYLKAAKKPSASTSKESSRSTRDSSEGSSKPVRPEHQNAEKSDSASRRRKSSPSRSRTSRRAVSRSRSRSRERSRGTPSASAGVPSGSRSSHAGSREREKENRDAKGIQSPVNAVKESRKPVEQDASSDVTSSADSTGPRVDKDKRKKLRCRDFDEKGYCMLGDNCPFDHGPDPVVVEDFPLPNIMPHPEMATRSVKPAVVAAPPPNFSIPPPGYAPIQPPTGVESKYQPEAYNPESPSLTSAPPVKGAVAMPAYSQPPPLLWSQPPPPPPTMLRFGPMRPFASVKMAVNQQPSDGGHSKSPVGGANGPRMSGAHPTPSYGNRKRTGRSEGPATAYGKYNKTLEVRRIPVPLNTISKLNGHFSTFGNVVNINVGFDSDPQGALITYATRGEALAAYKSTAPIFNNRFIKVFWHKAEQTETDRQEERLFKAAADEAPKDQQVDRASKNGTTAEDKPDANDNQRNESVGGHPPAKYVKTSDGFALSRCDIASPSDKEAEKPKCDRSVELQRTNLELFNNYMEQQKFLFAKLEACDDSKMKQQLMEMIKELETKIKAIIDEINLIKSTRDKKRSRGEIQRELLDAELELMTRRESGENLTELIVRLEKLRMEMKRLSAHEKIPFKSSNVHRGSPYFRKDKRNGRIPRYANLDKRTRSMIVYNLPTDEKNALVDHLQTFGPLEDVDFYPTKDPLVCKVLVSFVSRRNAEMAFSKGKEFNGRTLALEWIDNSDKLAQAVALGADCRSNVSPKALLASIDQDAGLSDDSARSEE